MITLEYNGETLNLPPDLYWSDELSWQPVEQTVERTITGAMIVSVAQRIAGRPVTLQPEGSSAWFTRELIETLRNWAGVPGREMTLTIMGQARQVVFRHQEPPVIDAQPIVYYRPSDIQSSDFYTATLRFMEV